MKDLSKYELAKVESVKKWYHSKVVWVNIIGLACVILTTFFASGEAIAKQIMGIEAAILAIINLILRVITNQGLSK